LSGGPLGHPWWPYQRPVPSPFRPPCGGRAECRERYGGLPLPSIRKTHPPGASPPTRSALFQPGGVIPIPLERAHGEASAASDRTAATPPERNGVSRGHRVHAMKTERWVRQRMPLAPSTPGRQGGPRLHRASWEGEPTSAPKPVSALEYVGVCVLVDGLTPSGTNHASFKILLFNASLPLLETGSFTPRVS
jgi:hypothetical protein